MNRKALSIKEVGECLSISRPTVLRLKEQGLLPFFRVGKRWRLMPKDLELFVLSNTVGCIQPEDKVMGA